MSMVGFSKKVHGMASLTYSELEKLIKIYGHDTFKDLILVLVEILGDIN
jgi:hypothetical protein